MHAVLPKVVVKEFGGHAVQLPDPGAPAYLPSSQAEQILLLYAPLLAYAPDLQAVHAVVP